MAGPVLTLDDQLTDGQPSDLEIADFQRADLRAPDREPADGKPADRKRADRHGSPGERADGNGADRPTAERTGDAGAEQLGASLATLDARTPTQAHGRAAIVAAVAGLPERVARALTTRAEEASAGAGFRSFSDSERPM